MYITKQLVTSMREVDGCYELTPELAAKYWTYKGLSKLVFDDDDNLIDIVEDTEKKAAWEAEEAEEKARKAPERNLKETRRTRSRYLKAFDTYKTNVFYGVEVETAEQKAEVLAWYSALLDITEQVTADNVPDMPEPPDCVGRYL